MSNFANRQQTNTGENIISLAEVINVHRVKLHQMNHMVMYASSSPTSIDHNEGLIHASSCYLSNVKYI